MARRQAGIGLGPSLPKREFCNPPPRNYDIASCIMEEIALEGLDGITFQALIVRLTARPGFVLSITDKTKAYIWEITKRLKHITAYLLEESRANLVLFDRRDSVDDRGNMFEPVNAPEDIYSYHPIDDQQARIRGSCKEYYTRRPYTSVVRRIKYDVMQKMYANKLVLVAPQQLREKMFMSVDSSIDLGELTIIQYCIVERVARARYIGEITRGKVSLAAMKIDPKSSFYQRKLLLKKKIITKQTLTMKFGTSRVTAAVSVLHLPKFYTFYETALQSIVSKTIESIQSVPNKMREMSQIRVTVGKHQLHNLLAPECSQVFQEVTLPYHEVHASEYDMEHNFEKRVKMTQKVVRYLALRDNRITPWNFTNLLTTKNGDEKEVAEEPVGEAYLPIRFHTSQESILHRLLLFIFESKGRGISLADVSEKTAVTQLDARTAVRFLQRHKMVVPILEDKKKTKQHCYVYHKFREANRNYQSAIEESEPGPTSSSSIIPSTTQKGLFLPLEEEQEAFENAIIWTVGDLQLVAAENTAVKDRIEEFFPKASKNLAVKHGRIVKKTLSKSELISKRCLLTYKNRNDEPSAELRLNTHVRQLIENFQSICDPETEEFKCDSALEHRFNQAEERDFVATQDKDRARSVMYTNPSGWQIVIELANIRPDFGRLPSFATTKTKDRASYILELIYTSRVIIGFQQILRGLRAKESGHQDVDKGKSDVDRRTLYRILGELQTMQLVQIFRIRIQKDNAVRACAIFTPFCVTMESKLVLSCIEFVVMSIAPRSHKTAEEKKALRTRRHLIRRHTGGAAKGCPSLQSAGAGAKAEYSKVGARPGTKPGSRILKKAVRGARHTTKVTIKAKRKIGDQTDLSTKARRKRARVEWSSMEDRFILASFLASVLFISRYNHNRVFMFNAVQIRDVFHLKVDPCRTKTSLAIRRRLHFLMKKHDFYSRYRYYLSEALQDTLLYRRHLKTFHEMNAGKIFCRISNSCILGVIEYLQGKFEKLSIDPKVIAKDEEEEREAAHSGNIVAVRQAKEEESQRTEIIPKGRITTAMQQLTGCLMVDSMDTPFDSESVAVWTARTAILSLVMRGDEVADVHRFLESISDEVLSFAINSLRIVGLTTWHKETSRFGPSMLLKRKLQAGLDPEKYINGAEFLTEFSETMRKNFPPNEQPHKAIFLLLCELNYLNLLEFQISLPDPVVSINPEWHEAFSSIAEGTGAASNFLNEDEQDDDVFDSKDVFEGSDRMDGSVFRQKRRPLSKTVSNKSTAYDVRKRQKLEQRHETSFEHCRPLSSDTDTDEDNGTRERDIQEILSLDASKLSPSKAAKMSNKAMRLIRSKINSNHDGNFVERHYFHVNLPGVEIIGEKIAFEQLISEGVQPKLTLKEIKMHLIKLIPYTRVGLTDAVEPLRKPSNLGKWEQLYDYIASTKEIGISLQFLQAKFTRKTLNEGLRSLIIQNAIFLVGVTFRKFVVVEFVGSWTMPVVHDKSCITLKKVVFRPWITSTGDIHWPVIDLAMSAVLGHIFRYPDTTVEALCNHFIPALSPVESMIIVDALVGFEFFNLYSLESKVKKTTAFSPPSVVSKNYAVDTFLDMETLHVEINPLSTSKYTKLQQLFLAEEQLAQKEASRTD